MAREFRLPRQAWAGIVRRTLGHMLVAVAISVVMSYIILEIFSQGIGEIGLIVAIIAPLALGGPMVLYMSVRQVELQLAYDRLEAAAARDSLTDCLNHGAFVDAVSVALRDEQSGGGALLVIDADHFKSINDRYGHASGDTALKLIVAAIRSSVGPDDIIGRLGGEEFGVFLPAAGAEQAQQTAETIRQSVQTIEFGSGAGAHILSVSIGGAITAEPAEFGAIFRSADEQLYKVKETGRNAVSLVVLLPRPAAPTAVKESTGLVYRGQEVKRSA
ncbi:GGDEF domain-containing protein [Pelagibacterium halotolerans]|uniref:diguanylate cyclase n=1 Tax=Pelagibacterium halotolerans (strain DSM 22347 / JCM 15775 / CGMCC 1.7692 / B2) TaxID=1082931 RepID=G4R988_PELHB|nr:GGDEF domain-containing protein [Pelagibacterium halotolerans]AEQ52468.1 diguanylate cyclase [Pelagibacterium halotolerans B2]QJR17805.1 GGDEF domain-containing protein [Pelagibacterium halotolerans]SEA37299.1 diguanylate cyclase (GGDEF) domain-containing protein [Pelagibacterium halotolerans]